jgi:hypothetical protein
MNIKAFFSAPLQLSLCSIGAQAADAIVALSPTDGIR